MNKVVLTKEQLKVLADYIVHRGFTEPAVVMEILDHFACMVEEKMELHPEYSLEEAMSQAHYGFGVRGFQPIAAEFERSVAHKYKKMFRALLAKTFTSPPYIIAFMVLGVVFAKALYVAGQHPGTYVAGVNDVIFWASIIYFGVFLAVRWNVFRKRKDLVRGSLGAMNNYWYIPFALTFVMSPHHLAGAGLTVYALVFSVYMVFLLAREIAMYRLIGIAEKDITDINDNYNAVLG